MVVCVQAFKTMPRGSAVTIFTPDDTHFEIALAAVNAGLHVLIAKPLVKSLKEHLELLAAAQANNVLCVVEVHKRFDPFYTDARDRIASLGDFSYMVRVSRAPSTLHPPPSTLHPPPSTLHPPPSTLHPPPSTLHPPPSTRLGTAAFPAGVHTDER